MLAKYELADNFSANAHAKDKQKLYPGQGCGESGAYPGITWGKVGEFIPDGMLMHRRAPHTPPIGAI